MDERWARYRERERQWGQWMAAAQRGDGASYEALLRDVLPVLRAYAGRRSPDEAAAEDLVQTVLLSIHRARHSYRPERSFAPWFWAIARHALVDAHRARGVRQRREVPLPEGSEGESLAPASPVRVPRLEPRDLEQALDHLPVRQRQAVQLLHFEGLSTEEAADRAGTTTGALKVRAHRGYRALRRLLGETYFGRE